MSNHPDQMSPLKDQERGKDSALVEGVEGFENVAVIKFLGNWTMESLHQSLDNNRVMLLNSDVVMIDSSRETDRPGLGELYRSLVPALRKIGRKKCVVFFGQKDLATSFTNGVARSIGIFTHAEISFVKDENEALKKIEKFAVRSSNEES